MSIRRHLTLALATLALLLTGCASTDPRVDATTWRLVGWSASSLKPTDFPITARFADGKVTGRSAVNTYTGSFTDGQGIAIAIGPLATTRMAGPEPAMRAERIYLALLSDSKKMLMDGRQLTLRDGNDDVTLVFEAATE